MYNKRDNFFTRELLLNALKEEHITQNELAEKIGVSQAAIANYLSGRNIPNLKIAQKISDVLQIPLTDFLSEIALEIVRPPCLYDKNGNEVVIRKGEKVFAECDFWAGEIMDNAARIIKNCPAIDDAVKILILGMLLKSRMDMTANIYKQFGLSEDANSGASDKD